MLHDACLSRVARWGTGLLVLGALACGAPAPPAARPPVAGPAATPTAPLPAGPVAASTLIPAPPVAPITVKVGIPSIDSDALPIIVPQRRQLFAQEGLDVEIVRMSANTAVTAIGVGEIEFTTAIGTALVAASQGLPVRVIASSDHRPMDAIIGRRDARTLADIRGGTLAVSSPGATMDLLAREVVKQVGLVPDQDIALLAIGEEPNRLTALRVGQADAAILGPPVIFQAQAEGYTNLSDVGDVVAMPINGIATATKLIDERPEIVRAFLRAYLRGLQLMTTAGNRGEMIRMVQELEELDDVSFAEKTYERIIRVLNVDGTVPDESVTRYLQLAQAAGRISDDVTARAAVDFRLIRELAGSAR